MTKNILPKSVERLANVLATLPGIGPKSANRLTFYLLGRTKEELSDFGGAFDQLKNNLVTCSTCQIISETDPCPICSDESRERTKLAVVEEPLDVMALEKARFNGRYHVLGGQISPLNNIGVEDLNINQLLERLKTEDLKEVILATDPSLEGEATALYIDEQIKSLVEADQLKKTLIVSRLARGLPIGGDLEYADELTLTRALEGRQSYSNG